MDKKGKKKETVPMRLFNPIRSGPRPDPCCPISQSLPWWCGAAHLSRIAEVNVCAGGGGGGSVCKGGMYMREGDGVSQDARGSSAGGIEVGCRCDACVD